MRKLISLVLALALSMLSVVTASAASVGISFNDKIEYLLSQGISEEFLENKETQQIEELYEMFYGKNIKFLGTETTELTEMFYSPDISTFGNIPASDMLLKFTAMAVIQEYNDGRRSEFIGVAVFVDYEWYRGHPMINKTDKIAVNWDASLFTYEADSFSLVEYKEVPDLATGSDWWIQTSTGSHPEEVTQGGLGYSAQLASLWTNGDFDVYGQKGTAHFWLKPRYKIYDGNTHSATMNVQYVHDKNPFGSLSFSAQGFTVTINSSFSDSTTRSVTHYYSV